MALRNIPLYVFYNNHLYSPFHQYAVRIKPANFNISFVTLDEAIFFRNLILDLHYIPRPDLYIPKKIWALPEKYQNLELPPARFISTPIEPLNTNRTKPGFDPQLLDLLTLSK